MVLFFNISALSVYDFFLQEKYYLRKQNQETIPYQRCVNIYDKCFGWGTFTISVKKMKVLMPGCSNVSLSR
ncbi:Hypothetical protein W5S_1198 [Pectobacterium parmentieri]|uniref:Uncharacterized protein n=1 Tax=Pectobacterium parmentieri TaxID=1905730 RepID=A0A0H3I1Q8_PECPM|nr:Hypothetical protein W5S_1198 [Pectobacterium parmentieri]